MNSSPGLDEGKMVAKDEQMHAAVVVTSGVNGGGEQYVRSVYVHGRPLGLMGTLVGSIPGWEAAGLPSVPVDVRGKWSLSRRGLARSLGGIPSERARLVRSFHALSANSPVNVVHMQYKREQVLLTRAASKVAPVVWSELGTFPARRGPVRTGLLEAYRRAARCASMVVCISPAVRDEVWKLLAPGQPEMLVIENGVDLSRFYPSASEREREASAAQFNLPLNRPIVVATSRLIGWKRMDVLLEAAKGAQDLLFVIAGEGPEWGRLQSMAGPNVVLLGHVDDTAALLRAAHCAVSCSEPGREGLPGALLEYAASGLPIAAVRGTVPDVYLREACAVVAEGEVELLGAVRQAVQGSVNRIGMEWASRRNIVDVAARHLRVFRELV